LFAIGGNVVGPCRRGHIAPRFTANGACSDCVHEKRGNKTRGGRVPPSNLLELVKRQHSEELNRISRLQAKLAEFKDASELRFIELCGAITNQYGENIL
jgi:hypothetical protein